MILFQRYVFTYILNSMHIGKEEKQKENKEAKMGEFTMIVLRSKDIFEHLA